MLRLNSLADLVGIGVDCEEISRFRKMESGMVKKIFTKKEIDYCSRKANPSQHFAARFAGKEAVMKCFGPSRKIPFNQIEIISGKGPPEVSIPSKVYDIKLSLSHSGNMAIAFAAVFKSGR